MQNLTPEQQQLIAKANAALTAYSTAGLELTNCFQDPKDGELIIKHCLQLGFVMLAADMMSRLISQEVKRVACLPGFEDLKEKLCRNGVKFDPASGEGEAQFAG